MDGHPFQSWFKHRVEEARVWDLNNRHEGKYVNAINVSQ